MSKVRTRLFSGLIFLLFIVFVALGLFLDHMFHIFYETKLTERMEKESSFLLSSMNVEDLNAEQNKKILNQAKRHLDMNASIVDVKGNIIHTTGQAEQRAVILNTLKSGLTPNKRNVH